MIPLEDYKRVITLLPILCVDLVLTDEQGRYLLAKRTNEPLMGQWWVVGGRVFKGETAEAAARRKLFEELGVKIDKLELIGVYEDVFDSNALGVPGNYHTLSLVFAGQLPGGASIKLDAQHADWRLSPSLPERFVIKPLRTTGDNA